MKIFVLLGTIRLEFLRPLQELEAFFARSSKNFEVLVQTGHTEFESSHMKIVPFMAPDDIAKGYDEADLVICHAGTGSVLKALHKGKKVIAVARYASLGEHVDDHQLDLLEEFAKKQYLIPWFKDDKIEDLMNQVEYFHPTKYESKKHLIINYLVDFIKNLD